MFTLLIGEQVRYYGFSAFGNYCKFTCAALRAARSHNFGKVNAVALCFYYGKSKIQKYQKNVEKFSEVCYNYL